MATTATQTTVPKYFDGTPRKLFIDGQWIDSISQETFETLDPSTGEVLAEIARVLDVKLEKLQAMDVRPPIEEIKRLTQDDPRYALAFRTMIDKKVSAAELLELANQKKGERHPKPKK